MFEEYFKVGMFDDVITLVKYNGIEVRTQVIELLMAKYKPK